MPEKKKKKEPRYKRWVIDEPTRAVLNSVWCKTDLPTSEELSSLACIFNVKPRKVQVWFQNKRQRKEPRGGNDREQEALSSHPLPSQPKEPSIPPPCFPLLPPVSQLHSFPSPCFPLLHPLPRLVPLPSCVVSPSFVDTEDDFPDIVRVCRKP